MFTIFPYCHVQFNKVIADLQKEAIPFGEQSVFDLAKLSRKGLVCDKAFLAECEANKFPEKTAAN